MSFLPTIISLFFMLCEARQHSTISVEIASKPEAPVVLHGTASAIIKEDTLGHPYRAFSVALSATNITSKDIVLLVTTMQGTALTPDNITDIRVHDYYFRPKLFEASSTESFQDDWHPNLEPSSDIREFPATAKASVSVSFVQFSDGSTWGDAELGNTIICGRNEAFKKLRSLVKTYQVHGEDDFVNELMKTSNVSRCYETLFDAMMQNVYSSHHKDANATIREFDTMLASANSHERDLKKK